MAMVKVEVMARIKGAKFCLIEGLRDLCSHLFGTKETLHVHKKAPCGSEVRG